MTTEKVQTKVPTKALVYISAALLFGGAVAAVIFMNMGTKSSQKSSMNTPAVLADCTVPSPLPTQTATDGGIWLSVSEVQALPMSGPAWTNVRDVACGPWVHPTLPSPNLADQRLSHSAQVLAGALVYARTGDPGLRNKVRDAIIAAKRTFDDYDTELNPQPPPTNPSLNPGTLSLGRQLGGLVIAADLIDLPTAPLAPGETVQADAEFRPWLDGIRTQYLPQSNSNWRTLKVTHQKTANNWGTYAGVSRIAASLYLGDSADVTNAANVFRAWLGERSFYPTWTEAPIPPDNFAPKQHTYFQKVSILENDSWMCNSSLSSWTAVNPPCVKNGRDLDGTLVQDIGHGGSIPASPGTLPVGHTGIMYSWEALAGVFVQAEMLRRVDGYSDVYSWGSLGAPGQELPALQRAMDFMVRSDWGIYNVDKHIPWIANYRYGTSYQTCYDVSAPFGDCDPLPAGRQMSWTDWTHAGYAPLPSGGGGCGGRSDSECMPLETQ